MQVPLFVCSYSAAIDQQRNTISVFHILEDISSASFPFAVPTFTVAALILRTGQESNAVEAALVTTFEGQEIFRYPLVLNFQGRLKLRAMVEVAGVSVPGPGTLQVSLRAAENQLASWSMSVKSIAQPTAQAELGV